MIFLISLQLLVLVVRDPSVRSRGCSVEVPFCGFSAALVGGGSMLFSFVLSEVDGLFASVDWQTALPPIPGKAAAKTLRFLVGEMQAETGGTVCFLQDCSTFLHRTIITLKMQRLFGSTTNNRKEYQSNIMWCASRRDF